MRVTQAITLRSTRTFHSEEEEEAADTITTIITTCTALTLDNMQNRAEIYSAAISPIFMQWWIALTLIAGASSR